MGDWLETYRGTVFRWEVDHNDHFTVAYYFARIADAGLGMLADLGLNPLDTPTTDCFVRYQRELRVGDVMHMESGVVHAEPGALVLGHKLFDTGAAALCTTVEQRVRVPGALPPETARRLEARRVAWDGPARERRPRPTGLAGFRDSARDTVKPAELDVSGGAALSHYIHRFSAANSHAIASFGMTPAYMRGEHRGFSTFEFQLEMGAPLRAGRLRRPPWRRRTASPIRSCRSPSSRPTPPASGSAPASSSCPSATRWSWPSSSRRWTSSPAAA